MRRDGSLSRREAPQEERPERKRSGLGTAAPSEMPNTGVKVVCRLRPMNDREKKAGTVPAATASTERKEVAVVRMLGGTRKVSTTFHFDDVLTSFSSQAEVFHATLEPLVSEVLSGFEATAFAYGQTGTGKTYTMEGDVESDAGRGLVPRAAAAVIDALHGGKYTDYTITVSYLEIYNEDLSDLLAPSHMQSQKLDLKDSGGGRGVCCIGLSEVPVSSVNDILDLVHRAQERRRVAETRVNARSSRSHSIFTMKVRCRKVVATGELENVGKLHLVDLAGSECAKKAAPASTEATSRPGVKPEGMDEERERKNINQSLLTLGRVITALRDGSCRVPYRDSKLTRLLQDSLGGRCKTVIIATISPALGAVEETISTLTYAEQASGIQNKPVASSLLRTLRYATSGEVKCDSNGNMLGNSDFAEMELKVAYLTQEVEEAQAALAKKYREAQEQADRAQVAEDRLVEAEEQLETARYSVKESKFVRGKLLGFADHQTEVATLMAAALNASSQHGEALAGKLSSSFAEVLASRRQVRDLLEAADATAMEAVTGVGRHVATATEAACQTHAAHAAAAEIAHVALQEQQRLLAELRASVGDSSSRLGQQAASISAEARKVLEDEQKTSKDSLSTIETAASQVAVTAEKVKADTIAATSRNGQTLQAQAETLQQDMSSSRAALKSSAEQLVEDLGAARKTSETGHDLACRRLRSSIQEPLTAHEASLQETERQARDHAVAAAQLLKTGTEDGEQARQQRRSVREALEAASAEHSSTAAQRPEALGKAHEAVRAASDAGAAAVERALDQLSVRLESASTGLAECSRSGQTAVGSAAAKADAMLREAWEEESARLEQMQATMTQAAEEQRAGHASQAMQEAAAAASQALSTALATALAELATARDNVACQVAELQQQRSWEQRMVEMLTQQREALQADVASQQAELQAATQQLEAAQAEIAALRTAQTQRRAQALEAIQSMVAAELASLGDALAEGTTAVEGKVAAARDRAQAVGKAAGEAEERSRRSCLEVAAGAGEWSEAAGRSCGAVSAAQARALAAAEDVEEAGKAAETSLAELQSQGAAWGRACDGVSGLLEDCARQRGVLVEAAAALRPAWQSKREEVEAAVQEWGAGNGRIGEELALVAGDAAATGRELMSLRGNVAAACRNAVAEAETWRSEACTHGDSLAALAQLAETTADEAAAAEARRSKDSEQLSQAAQELCSRSGQSVSDAASLQSAIAAHAEAMPVDFASTDAAMAAAAAGLEALSGQAAAAFAASSTGVESLAAAHATAAQGVCEAVAAQADKAASAAKLGGTVASHHQKASEATLVALRQHWCRSDEVREAALRAMEAAAESSSTSAKGASEEASAKLSSRLSAGGAAKDQASASLQALGADATARLGGMQKALREGLAARPFAAFVEEVEAVPAWPEAAARPRLELLPRPREEDFVAEFRGREADFNDAENLGPLNKSPTPRGSPAGVAADKRLLAKEALRALALDSSGPPRRALAEIN